jgi:hypothetical protein
MKHAGGRPSKYTPEELQTKIDKYFKKCLENKGVFIDKLGREHKVPDPIIPTIAGCAYEIDLDRESFYKYEKKDEFRNIIKKAREYIIAQWENKLINTNTNAGGIIFISKNYGYTDKQEIEVSGDVNFNLTGLPKL